MKSFIFILFNLKNRGQDLAEYGMLIGLVALAVIFVVTIFGQALHDYWVQLVGQLPF